jgi:hypothetical protein
MTLADSRYRRNLIRDCLCNSPEFETRPQNLQISPDHSGFQEKNGMISMIEKIYADVGVNLRNQFPLSRVNLSRRNDRAKFNVTVICHLSFVICHNAGYQCYTFLSLDKESRLLD